MAILRRGQGATRTVAILGILLLVLTIYPFVRGQTTASTQSGAFVPPSFSSGHAASVVLGQTGFTQGSIDSGANPSSVSAAGLVASTAVAVDKSGDVWVAEWHDGRVVEFKAPFSNGEAASVVLGASDFNSLDGCNCTGPADLTGYTSPANATNLDLPVAITFDPSGNLWVADQAMGRVLEFTAPFTNGEAASVVLGKTSFTSELYSSYASDVVLSGAYNSTNIAFPTGVASDPSGNIWVADGGNRVLEFTPPFTNGEAASVVLGQPDFTSTSSGNSPSSLYCACSLATDSSGNVWVGDSYNSRVLEFVKGSGFTNGQPASLVLGEAGFGAQAGGITSTLMRDPTGVAVDNAGDVWVADYSDNRVLEFQAPVTSGEAASVVLGQTGFTQSAAATSSTGLDYPHAVAVDSSGNVWVLDVSNFRVLGFTAPPATISTISTSTSASSSSISFSYLGVIAVGAALYGVVSSLALRKRNGH